MLWAGGHGYDLNTLIAPSHLHLVTAYYIDDHGDIVGRGTLPNGDQRAFPLVRNPSVPLPSGPASARPLPVTGLMDNSAAAWCWPGTRPSTAASRLPSANEAGSGLPARYRSKSSSLPFFWRTAIASAFQVAEPVVSGSRSAWPPHLFWSAADSRFSLDDRPSGGRCTRSCSARHAAPRIHGLRPGERAARRWRIAIVYLAAASGLPDGRPGSSR